MAKQTKKEKQKSTVKKHEDVQESQPSKKVDAEAIKSEMDDILDEIDSVLEENAEQFVQDYVQKGGQ